MAYALDLSSARAKLERGKTHIDALRVEIEKVYANGSPITLRREYEPEQRRVVVRIDRVVDIPDNWSLIVGDAAHNLRCALDHLCWQLAVRHFNGVEPTDRNILQMIHFPIVTDKRKWQHSCIHQWMDRSDSDKVKDFQPFNLGPQSRTKGYRHPFEGFCGFDGIDNVDKHRRIHLTYIAPRLKSFAPEDTRVFHDCMPATGFINVAFSGFPRKPGDELAHVEVIPTGPNPDVDFETNLAGYVAIGERWDVIKALDAFTEGVERLLSLF